MKSSRKISKGWSLLSSLSAHVDRMTSKQREFVGKLIRYADPFNVEEELSEKQMKYLKWLFGYYVNGDKSTKWSGE